MTPFIRAIVFALAVSTQVAAAACVDTLKPDATMISNGFGGNPFNTRNSPSSINAKNVDQLVLAMSHGGAEVGERRGVPVVTSQAIFAAIKLHVVAINRTSGCEYWRYSPFPQKVNPRLVGFRSIYLLDEGNNKPRILFAGDRDGNLHAIDAQSGKLIWKKFLGTDERSHIITGTPIAANGKLFVPVSTIETVRTVFVTDECCRSHGLVRAVDPYTGEIIWTFHVTGDAKQQADNPKRMGPNGGSVWSSPAVDLATNTLFIGTGQNLTRPVTTTSDAVIALDMDTGKMKWSYQTTANDAWNVSCNVPAEWKKEEKCDRPAGSDFDVGAAPLLTTIPGGPQAVIAGAKSGVVYALDRSTGKLIWSKRLGAGGGLGGIHWGMASDGTKLYAGVSDLSLQKETILRAPGSPVKQIISKDGKPGVYALKLTDGSIAWEAHPMREFEGKEVPAIFSAALSVTNDVVFAGAMNGMLYGFNANDGTILWSFDTRGIQGKVDAEGHKVRGGTIDGAGPIVAGDDLLVNSGYSSFGDATQFFGGYGNALLVFRLPEKPNIGSSRDLTK
jgi:polyvinyl alcohol dehydrogenase (cytochrome)